MNNPTTPVEAEKKTLESYLECIDNLDSYKKRYFFAWFLPTLIGLALLATSYYLYQNISISNYWLFFIAIMGGIFIGIGGSMLTMTGQSSLILEYIDTGKVKARIKEIDSAPKAPKKQRDDWE